MNFPNTAMSLAIQKAAAPLLAAANLAEADTKPVITLNDEGKELIDAVAAERLAASRNGTDSNEAKLSNEEASKLRAMAQFDPLVFFEDSHVVIRKETMTSAAWALDSEIIQAARSLYFQIYNEQKVAYPGERVTLDHVIDGFYASVEIEGFWGEGLAHKLLKLVSMQPSWHSAAYNAARASGWMTFEVKSIDELVLASKAQELNGNAVTNIKNLAPVIAKMTGGKVKAEDIEAQTIRSLNEKAQDAAEFSRGLLPVIRAFVEAATEYVDEHGVEYGFEDLDPKTRLGILAKLRPSIMRPTSDPRVIKGDTTEFMMIVGEAFAAANHISDVVDFLTREVDRQRM